MNFILPIYICPTFHLLIGTAPLNANIHYAVPFNSAKKFTKYLKTNKLMATNKVRVAGLFPALADPKGKNLLAFQHAAFKVMTGLTEADGVPQSRFEFTSITNRKALEKLGAAKDQVEIRVYEAESTNLIGEALKPAGNTLGFEQVLEVLRTLALPPAPERSEEPAEAAEAGEGEL